MRAVANFHAQPSQVVLDFAALFGESWLISLYSGYCSQFKTPSPMSLRSWVTLEIVCHLVRRTHSQIHMRLLLCVSLRLRMRTFCQSTDGPGLEFFTNRYRHCDSLANTDAWGWTEYFCRLLCLVSYARSADSVLYGVLCLSPAEITVENFSVVNHFRAWLTKAVWIRPSVSRIGAADNPPFPQIRVVSFKK